MRTRGVVLGIFVAVLALFTFAETKYKPHSNSKESRSAHLQIVPDLKQRLARFHQVQMPFKTAGLSPRDQKMIAKLVDACRDLDAIYWRQADPAGLQLYQSLAGSTDPRDAELRRYLW